MLYRNDRDVLTNKVVVAFPPSKASNPIAGSAYLLDKPALRFSHQNHVGTAICPLVRRALDEQIVRMRMRLWILPKSHQAVEGGPKRSIEIVRHTGIVQVAFDIRLGLFFSIFTLRAHERL